MLGYILILSEYDSHLYLMSVCSRVKPVSLKRCASIDVIYDFLALVCLHLRQSFLTCGQTPTEPFNSCVGQARLQDPPRMSQEKHLTI